MIVLDRKKPISALKLIHTLNHTQTNRYCNISTDHLKFIETLDYTFGERIYDLRAGLYKITIDDVDYIISVHIDVRDKYSGDFLVIKNKNDITLYAAGSTPYHIIPYRINSNIINSNVYNIETINDNIDIIIVGGETNIIGTPSIYNPAIINRISSIKATTKSKSEFDSININFNNTLGKLPNGVRDYIVINSDQSISYSVINTTAEILSGFLDWEYHESRSNSDYYVFFAKYPNVKLNNAADSIRCSHFETISFDELINRDTNKNCIATSYGSYSNGIWIKIAKSILDIHGDKDFGSEMQKWIIAQNLSDNPIYIEYEIANTKYNKILIDKYHIKTWYPETIIVLDNNQDFSVFYKSL